MPCFHGGRLAGDECELFDLHDTGDCPHVNRKLASNSTLKSFVKEREFCTFARSLAPFSRCRQAHHIHAKHVRFPCSAVVNVLIFACGCFNF